MLSKKAQHLTGNLIFSALLRIRRNKWLILFAIFTLYLFVHIKSSLLSQQVKSGNHQHISGDVVSFTAGGIAEHLPLVSVSETSAAPNIAADGHVQSRIPFAISHKVAKKKKLLQTRLANKKVALDLKLKDLLPVIPGWGEGGKGVQLTSDRDVEEAQKVFKNGAYNVYISDRIAPNRTIRPVAAQECNDVRYDIDQLPDVSVIVIFTNEIFSALVRTVRSVIDRTPPKLLKEIILVDDFSDRDYLKDTLQDYIDVYWNTIPRHPNHAGSQDRGLVRLVHLPERQGLIKARLKGANEAVGDVLLFLDSHCEATDRWLEPLVQRIKENRRVFICPVIDIINDKTLEYHSVDPYYFQLGGFDWTGHFTWINRHEQDSMEPTKATKSPTMAGGLFAVDRKYFFEVGSYDSDMKLWGGENLELSFRAWQCGGRVEIHPCSHVGHIFRDFHPYSFNGLDSHGYNTLRTVLVWMDEYSRYFFMSRPDLLKMDAGNLTSRKQLRENLKCASFKWYLDNVYDKRKFLYDKDVIAYGHMKNNQTNLCVDVLNRHETEGERAGLYTCETMTHPLEATTNQLFSYSRRREIRREEGCLTITKPKGKPEIHEDTAEEDSATQEYKVKVFAKVLLKLCEEPEFVSSTRKSKSISRHQRQQWRHEAVDSDGNHKFIINEATGQCLTTENSSSFSDLQATTCDRNDPKQYWSFQIYTGLEPFHDSSTTTAITAR